MRSRGGMFFLQSPYPQHFFHAPNPPFVKKFRAPERIGYQGTAIFAQPPPPPCRRARRRADNPADKPVCNTDNRICRVRRSRTSPRRTSARRSRTNPRRTSDRPHACRPSCLYAVCLPPTRPRARRVCKSHRSRRTSAESTNPQLRVVHPPSPRNPQYPSYIRAWQSAESPSADIGGLVRAEKRRQLPNTQMFLACNKLIINNRIRNIHRKMLNHIHLPANFAPKTRRPQPIHPPLFFAEKSAHLNQSKVNNNDRTIVLD